MANVTKPVALNETFKATDTVSGSEKNLAEVLLLLVDQFRGKGIVSDSNEIGKAVTSIKLDATGKITSNKDAVIELLRATKISDPEQAVAFHNALPGGRNIGPYFSDAADWEDNKAQFWKRLQSGTFNRSAAYIAAHPDEPKDVTFTLFEGLFPGDYWQLSEKIRSRQDGQTAQTNAGTDYVMIAGFDTLYGNGDGTDNVDYHHVVCVPGRPDSTTNLCFGQRRMNSTDTSNGGYKGSEMFTTCIGSVTTTAKKFSESNTATINNQLYAQFGAHLATTRELLSKAMNSSKVNRWGDASGGASDWEWTSCQACLMSEVEVYGSISVSSTVFDVGSAKLQLPVFKFFPIAVNNRSQWYWLKAVSNSTSFCHVYDRGNAGSGSASIAGGGVRPRFVLKA